MDPIRFRGTIRYWNPDKASGLTVADIPAECVARLGGLRQQHVEGTLNGVPFGSNVMPAGAGRLALSVSKAMLKSADVEVGGSADVEILSIGRRA